ncbi:MAG: hypothetical protein Q7K03_09285 [Dehalococcoidia bacterium]|nr:hypothetical protein [Dehalococcoidia bacterium]
MSSSRSAANGGIQWVSAEELRAAFSKERIAERANQGTLMRRVLDYDNHLSPRQRGLLDEPYCTRSQMILYTELNGQPVAIAGSVLI